MIPREDEYASGLEVRQGGCSPEGVRDQHLKRVNGASGKVDVGGERFLRQPTHLIMKDLHAVRLIDEDGDLKGQNLIVVDHQLPHLAVG